MYTLKKGDIFSAINKSSGRSLLLHGCNIEGVMGAGIAYQVQRRYPDAFQVYEDHLNSGLKKEDYLGSFCIADISDDLSIVNGFTQRLLRDKSGKPCGARVEYIEEILNSIDELSAFDKYDNFFTVQVGCGLGGLNWNKDVKKLFEKTKREWRIYYI